MRNQKCASACQIIESPRGPTGKTITFALRGIHSRYEPFLKSAGTTGRRDHAPQGLAGGGPALAGSQRLIAANGAVKELPGCFSLNVAAGDIIEIETPGGGGFGPATRS